MIIQISKIFEVFNIIKLKIKAKTIQKKKIELFSHNLILISSVLTNK